MESHSKNIEYLWRPNDESVGTRAKYDLEAAHWYRSFKSAELQNRPISIRADLNVIGLFVQLVFTFLVLIVALVIDFVKWLRS
ncbi:hypothetical protein [Gaetbulibacter saemankumensis]|uniref:hypothetical protein n=1 Tax=Gaetbulibacter saemankumensis TaxID=311208 RepID=UPI000485AEE2|nr:hypothetical protein [Gaetbulibacter saemankumensis]